VAYTPVIHELVAYVSGQFRDGDAFMSWAKSVEMYR
jgi:hypothetical protein